MTTADKILKLIETVEPADIAKLDEIDARIWCYLNGHKFAFTKWDRVFIIDENQCEIEKLNGLCTLGYTRSRDALKAIRPEGYFSIIRQHTEYTEVNSMLGVVGKGYGLFCTKPLPTEELAELHAIIQAVTYARGEK